MLKSEKDRLWLKEKLIDDAIDVSIGKLPADWSMTHEERVQLINAPFPRIRVHDTETRTHATSMSTKSGVRLKPWAWSSLFRSWE